MPVWSLITGRKATSLPEPGRIRRKLVKTLRIWARVARRLIINPLIRTVVKLVLFVFDAPRGLYCLGWALDPSNKEDKKYFLFYSFCAWVVGLMLGSVLILRPHAGEWPLILATIGPLIAIGRGVYWLADRLTSPTRNKIRIERERAQKEIELEIAMAERVLVSPAEAPDGLFLHPYLPFLPSKMVNLRADQSEPTQPNTLS